MRIVDGRNLKKFHIIVWYRQEAKSQFGGFFKDKKSRGE